MDDSGIFGMGIGTIVMLIAVLFGFSLFGSINWKFLLSLFMLVAVGISVIGFALGKIKNFKYILYITMICIGITFILEVTPIVIIGIFIVAGTMWKFSPHKQPAIFVALIGMGMLLVLYGSRALILLGLTP